MLTQQQMTEVQRMMGIEFVVSIELPDNTVALVSDASSAWAAVWETLVAIDAEDQEAAADELIAAMWWSWSNRFPTTCYIEGDIFRVTVVR